MLDLKNGRIVFLTAIPALALGGLVYLFFWFSLPGVRTASDTTLISSCIDSYWKTLKPQNISIDEFYMINGFCYDSLGSQLLLDEEVIRRDNFIFQRHENVVLMYMVVTITLSGVVLAGLQLLASYKLAMLGHGELAGGGEITYSRDAVSFKSSVVGLMILAISFAFFMVFVIDVYALKEGGSAPSAPGANIQQSQTQRLLFSAPPSPPTGSRTSPQLVASPTVSAPPVPP